MTFKSLYFFMEVLQRDLRDDNSAAPEEYDIQEFVFFYYNDYFFRILILLLHLYSIIYDIKNQEAFLFLKMIMTPN